MERAKVQKLKKDGWKLGSASDFLNLTDEEVAYVEMKVSLSQFLHEKRIKQNWTQDQLAKKLCSSQSRVAKMENGDPSVSIDLLVKSLFAMGVSKKELGKILC
jgi:DNA-binding XRE family transcriptional regulator